MKPKGTRTPARSQSEAAGQVEVDIAKLEARLKELRETLTAEHGGDWQKLHKLVDEEHQTDRKLQSLMSEWETLSEELA